MDKQRRFEPIPIAVEATARAVIDAAIKVHKKLGPGLLESVYETCLAQELRKRGLGVQTEIALPITYEDLELEAAMRLDMLIENHLIVELKAVEKMIPLYKAQLLTYLKLSNLRLGLLLNFNVPLMKNGIERVVR